MTASTQPTTARPGAGLVSTVSARSSRSAMVAIAAVVAYWTLSTAVIVVNPQWDPTDRQLSEYALGHHGWLQVGAFVATGVAYAALLVGLRRHVTGTAGRIGLALLAICAVGAVGVGMFVTDPMTTPPEELSTRGLLHMLFGAAQLVLLPFAAVLVTRALARATNRPGLRWVAMLPLVAFVTCWVPQVAGLLDADVLDRLLFLAYTIWVVVVARAPRTR